MKKKINQLIRASVIGLVALSVIQGYLIKNTYILKKEAFVAQTRQSIARLDDMSSTLDSLSYVWKDNFLNSMTDYKISKISRSNVLKNLQLSIDSINERYNREYQKELRQRDINYGIKFQKEILTIILMDSVTNDTIYDYKKSSVPIVLGETIDDHKAIQINTTTWQTDHTSQRVVDGEPRNILFYFMFITQDNIDIVDWKSIIFKRMIGLLILSLIIFLIVIALLYSSIKSLITQKKIADVKTDFVNNITHELKTPLATLTLATKMLQNEAIKEQPSVYENTLNTVERQNVRLQKLIDQVLTNSMGYKEIKLKKENVTIKDYLNTIIDDFTMACKTKNAIIERAINIENKIINIDKFYITTAIYNILENAVKYNDGDATIIFKASVNKALKIEITDNGKGIAEKDRKHIFEKFYRAGNQEVHNVKGLGLGLYYTKQILKAHNGSIKLDSKLGKGSTFTLTIPLT